MAEDEFEKLRREFLQSIVQGEAPRQVIEKIIMAIATLSEVEEYALYFSPERKAELFLASKNFHPEIGREEDPTFSERYTIHNLQDTTLKISSNNYHYFEIYLNRSPIGTLVIVSAKDLSPYLSHVIDTCCYNLSIAYERLISNGGIQLALDRLQVLTEFYQLISKNVKLERIYKITAREAAFRFRAHSTLLLTSSDGGRTLILQEKFGCSSSQIGQTFQVENDILGQAIKIRSFISTKTPSSSFSPKFFSLLTGLDAQTVDVCCLETFGECIGVILLCYRGTSAIQEKDASRLEEFGKAAAIVMSNAKTQERITAYTEKLEDLVSSRTADLAIQTRRAERASNAKSQFLANMSHELRTPLTTIVGYCKIIADGLFGETNEAQSEALSSIIRSSEHLKTLINDVLNLEVIETGEENPEPSSMILGEVVSDVSKLLIQSAINKGISFDTIKCDDPTYKTILYADPKHTKQILLNLFSNAIKYTPRGGRVSVSASRDEDQARIAICDTGVGIPAHKRERLFKRFERGEDEYSKSQEGTGIGLNLTRRLVEANNGKIGVESEEGRGSTFWISLPTITTLCSHDSSQATQNRNLRLDGLKILVVDDNTDTLAILKISLEGVGATVWTANCRKNGLHIVDQEELDIILTDIAMPYESGLEFIEGVRLRTDKKGTLPIVAISASAFPEDKKIALETGASIFVSKPFNPADVIVNIANLLFS